MIMIMITIIIEDIHKAPTPWLKALNDANRLNTYMYIETKIIINLT